MKYLLGVVLSALVAFGCQVQQKPQDELPAVERVVFDLFESISTFNYQSMREHCTDDFVLFEDGQSMSLDDVINLVKGMEGKVTLHYKLEDVKTTIEGSFAWMTLRNKAVMTMDGQPTNLEWLESAVLRKEEGLWKLAFYHSTSVQGSEESDGPG